MSKNTLNYFPRGSKKKVEGDSNFIFNAKETTKKRARDGDKFVFSNKKRFKNKEAEDFIADPDFVIGAERQDDDLEDAVEVTNKVSKFNPVKGSLVMMAVCQVHKDQFIVGNLTRNKKAYMSAIDGKITDKKVGQYVYGVVVGTRNKASDANFINRNRNLQLTDNLNIFNTFLTSEKLQKGMQLQGIVESKEGKGYIINLCMKDESKAFLNFSDYKGKELQEGQQVTVILKGNKSKSQKIIKCIHHSAIENIEEWAIDLSTEVNFECVKPGFLVQGRIDSIVENGINVSFGKGVNGVVFIDHLQQDLSKYKKGKKILTRVISMDFEKKRVGLSELEHIVHLKPAVAKAKAGEVLTNVKVVKKVYGKSYLVEGESIESEKKIQCFLHQNHIAAALSLKLARQNKPGAQVENKSSGKNTQEGGKKRKKEEVNSKELPGFEVGEPLGCNIRIKEFNYFDGLPIASSLEGINESAVLNWDNVKGGITVEGTIREVVEDNYVVVDINEDIFGRVYRAHLSDAPQKTISKKLKNSVGKKMTFKTWKADSKNEILELTKKESIVKDKVFVPSDIDDSKVRNGVKLTGTLIAQDEKGYIIEFYNNLRGFLPFLSMEKYNKKYAFKKGTLIDAYLLFKTKDGLSLTVSEEESINFKPKKGQDGAAQTKQKVYIPKEVHFERGAKAKGVVCKFDKSCSFPLTVKLSDKQLGIVFFTDLGLKDGFDENELERIFAIGTVIDVYIKTPKEGEGKIECSLISPEKQKSKSEFVEGAKVLCRYVKFKNGFGATVQLTPSKYGFIDVCELTDGVEKFDRTIFFARVIDTNQAKIQLSARDSLVDNEKYKILGPDGTSLEFKNCFGKEQKQGDIRNLIAKYHNWRELLTENLLVRGYVTSINQHGVFIKLARNLSVRASNKEISDNPTVTPESFLTPNTIVLSRILNFYKDKVNVTLRESIVTYGIDEVDISEMQPGLKAKLLVLSVAANVAFCQIIGSRYKCKVKLTKHDPKVKVGQKIIARIKSVSPDTPPRIMMHEVDECNEEMTQDYADMIELIEKVRAVQQQDYSEKDLKADEEKPDEVNINADEVEQNIEDLQELLEVGEESEDLEMDEEAKKITKFLRFDEGGDSEVDYDEEGEMGIESEGEMGIEAEGEMDMEVDGEGDDEDKSEQSEGKTKDKKKEKEKKSMHKHIQEEIQIMLKERGMAPEEHDEDYYEQMLLSNPNNSFVWIHYISHILSKQGYGKAKELCERAVKTIDITKLKEKLNLWIAYMNFESKFGKEKEFQSIVKRALKINDQKEIYLAVIDIYRQRKNYKIIEGIYIILTRKYNFHLDIWKKYVEYLFEAHSIKDNSKHDDHILLQDVELTEKEKVLSKALQILDRKDQIELIRKYATEEYRHGNTEKGRTMYESIIHSYPKRTDIISTFLDMEIKCSKNKQNVRKIFEKLLARENAKLKQVKFLFKRYLEFEVEHGTEKDVEKVKQKAAEFAQKFGKGDDESEEASEEDEGDEEEAGEGEEAENEEAGDSEEGEDEEMSEESD